MILNFFEILFKKFRVVYLKNNFHFINRRNKLSYKKQNKFFFKCLNLNVQK